MTDSTPMVPEVFIQVPRWALDRALADHTARCPRCNGDGEAACVDEWYRQSLDKWIEHAQQLADWRKRAAKVGAKK